MQTLAEMASRSFGRLMRWPEHVEMLDSECPNCGSGTLVLAKACPHCGAPIALRRAGMAVAGALVLLLVAMLVAGVVALRGHRLAAATGAPADEQIAAPSTTDLSWLATAMSDCDAQAKTDLGALHFLVTPLVSVDKDPQPWRAKSINVAGNGILLRAGDTLDGLKSGTLRIYPADYEFGIFDEVSDPVYKWRPSAGVAKFSAAGTGSISTFNVRFRTSHSGHDPEWGGSFTRLDGSCYWVNAIISK
jgi:ribosomal protein S27AE